MKGRIILMFLSNQFWAPRKAYKPCGMFTYRHLILLLPCIAMLNGLLYISRKITKQQVSKVTRVLAVVLTILEGVKIYFNFYWGYTWLNAWFPISYCSIFIYALWLSGFGKGKLKDIGDAFIAGAGIMGGMAFLLFPSTSLMIYPSMHYLCLYSMTFHTMMIYMGIIYLFKLNIKLDKKLYKKYVLIFLSFAIIAIILNTNFESNLMMLREPANIPLPFLHKLHSVTPWGYTIFVFNAYLFGPYCITAYLSKFIKNKKVKASAYN